MLPSKLKDYFESDEVQQAVNEVSALDAAAMKEMAAFDLLAQVSKIYLALRPFINWADDFFLIPKKIRTALKAFKVFLDGVVDYTGETE